MCSFDANASFNVNIEYFEQRPKNIVLKVWNKSNYKVENSGRGMLQNNHILYKNLPKWN